MRSKICVRNMTFCFTTEQLKECVRDSVCVKEREKERERSGRERERERERERKRERERREER